MVAIKRGFLHVKYTEMYKKVKILNTEVFEDNQYFFFSLKLYNLIVIKKTFLAIFRNSIYIFVCFYIL